jgi:tetratricopeptide (TPR) repeat protein
MSRIDQLLAFLADDPTDSFTLYALATEYRAVGNAAEAWKYYDLLLHDHPTYVGTYYHAAALLIELNRRDEAEQVYRTGLIEARKQGQHHAAAELQSALASPIKNWLVIPSPILARPPNVSRPHGSDIFRLRVFALRAVHAHAVTDLSGQLDLKHQKRVFAPTHDRWK